MLRRVVSFVVAGLILAAVGARAGTMVSYPSGSETVSG